MSSWRSFPRSPFDSVQLLAILGQEQLVEVQGPRRARGTASREVSSWKGVSLLETNVYHPAKLSVHSWWGKEQPRNCFHTGKDCELLQLKNSCSNQLLLLCLSTQSDWWVFVPPSQRKQTNKTPQANHKVKALLAIWFISAIGKNYLIQRNFPSCPGVA